MQRKHDEYEDISLKNSFKNDFSSILLGLRLNRSDSHSSSISSGNLPPYNRTKVSNEHIAPSHPRSRSIKQRFSLFSVYLVIERYAHFDRSSYLNTLTELYMIGRLSKEIIIESFLIFQANFVDIHRKIMHWQKVADEHN